MSDCQNKYNFCQFAIRFVNLITEVPKDLYDFIFCLPNLGKFIDQNRMTTVFEV
jgi:hypothetical protein